MNLEPRIFASSDSPVAVSSTPACRRPQDILRLKTQNTGIMASGAEVVFVMPKHTEEGQKIAEGFQKLQDELLQSVDLEWTSQQIAEVRKLQAAGRKIIQKCLDQAKSHPEELKEHIEREAKLAKADKYKQVYGSIHSLIKDDDGFKEACALCQSLQVSAEVKMPEFRQQTNDLSALYMNGCRVKVGQVSGTPGPHSIQNLVND